MQKKIDNPKNHMNIPEDYFKNLHGKVIERIELDQSCKKIAKLNNSKNIASSALFKWIGVTAVACGIFLIFTVSGIFTNHDSNPLSNLYVSTEIINSSQISEDDYYQLISDMMDDEDNNKYWISENLQLDYTK